MDCHGYTCFQFDGRFRFFVHFFGSSQELLFKVEPKISRIFTFSDEPKMIWLKSTNVFVFHRVFLKMWNLICFQKKKALYECVFLEAQSTIRDAFKNAQSTNSKNMIILECLLRSADSV